MHSQSHELSPATTGFNLIIGAILVLLFATVGANAASPPCTPEMLDVQVLPPLEPNTASELHILVIEFKNRSQSSCQLHAASLELLPQSGADPLTNSFFNEQGLSPSEREFEQKDAVLLPGETAPLLIAWYSRESFMQASCVNRDRLSLSTGDDRAPLLTVEHLWMHLCDRAYISHYRLGHYAGEPVPAEWLKRLGAEPADFASAPLIESQLSQKPPIVAEMRSDREMLHDFMELFLQLPDEDHDCPFVVLRKREANGVTKAYLNHCKIMTAEESARLHPQHREWTSVLNLPALGLQPENTGTVEYEVISSIMENGRPAYAHATATLVIRDPHFPPLPAIDSPFPECQAAQLQGTRLATLHGGKWHDAVIYNMTNTSQQICRLGGMPNLTFMHPAGQSYSAIPSPCPNCVDPLFQPRPSGWIDLKPQQSAHFIVGASRFPQDSGPWRQICDTVETLDLKFSGEDQSMSLPFGVGACAQVNFSAWRAGKYDDDPQNLAYANSTAKKPQAELPKRCATADFSELGRPVFLNQGAEMSFGLSLSRPTVLFGEPVLLHLWIENLGDKEASILSCMTLDFFWGEGFEVYDAYGHRLLKKREIKSLKNEGKVSTEPGKSCVGPWMCTRNFFIPIPPKTCTNGSAYDLPHDFNRNLADSYDLSPGVYYVVPAGNFDENLCRKTVPRLDPATLVDKLKITIEQN